MLILLFVHNFGLPLYDNALLLLISINSSNINTSINILPARRYASAVLAVIVSCLSVRHMSVLYQNG